MASRAKGYQALPLLIFHLCHVGGEPENEATCIWLHCYDNHSVEISFHTICYETDMLSIYAHTIRGQRSH